MAYPKRKKRRSPRRPGQTLSQFAAARDLSEATARALAANGQLETVDVNNVKIVTPRGAAAWDAIWAPVEPAAVSATIAEKSDPEIHESAEARSSSGATAE